MRLKSKLRGEALKTTDGLNFATLDEFKSHFRRIYRPTETLSQLQLQLANIYQLPEESVISYKIRVCDLAKRIKSAYITENNPEPNDLALFNAELAAAELKFFKDGLIDSIRLELGNENTLAAASERAHIIHHEIIARNNKRQGMQPPVEDKNITPIQCQLCLEMTHTAKYCPLNSKKPDINDPSNESEKALTDKKLNAIIEEKLAAFASAQAEKQQPRIQCTFCQKFGHTENVCRSKQRANNLTTQINQNGQGSTQNSNNRNIQISRNTNQQNPSSNIICNFCNRRGHLQRDCRTKRAQENQNQQYNSNNRSNNRQVMVRSQNNITPNNQNRNYNYQQNPNYQTNYNSNGNNQRYTNFNEGRVNTNHSRYPPNQYQGNFYNQPFNPYAPNYRQQRMNYYQQPMNAPVCNFCKLLGHGINRCPTFAQRFSAQENPMILPQTSAPGSTSTNQRSIQVTEMN